MDWIYSAHVYKYLYRKAAPPKESIGYTPGPPPVCNHCLVVSSREYVYAMLYSMMYITVLIGYMPNYAQKSDSTHS